MALWYNTRMKRTTIYLDDADRVAIKVIRERYGMDTDSAAIRFSLRVIADAAYLQVPHVSEQEPRATARPDA